MYRLPARYCLPSKWIRQFFESFQSLHPSPRCLLDFVFPAYMTLNPNQLQYLPCVPTISYHIQHQAKTFLIFSPLYTPNQYQHRKPPKHQVLHSSSLSLLSSPPPGASSSACSSSASRSTSNSPSPTPGIAAWSTSKSSPRSIWNNVGAADAF